MELYHATNYTQCPIDSSFFSSPRYPEISIHGIIVLSVPFSTYATYCIVKVTPKQMSGVKWVLLNVHIWTMVIEVVLNVLSIPMMFFPSGSGIMLGWGRYMGIPSSFLLYSIQALVSVFATSICALFENRQNTLQTKWKIRRTWIRVVLNAFNYLVACVTVLPPYFRHFDVTSIKLSILQTIPCPVNTFFSPDVYILTDNPAFATLFMLIQTIVLAPQAAFFVIHTWYHLVYVHMFRVSPATRHMQLKFLVASLIQVSIPANMIMIPILYIWFSIHTGYYNQQFNNHILLILSLHGLLSSVCLIVVHKPYRTHFIKMVSMGRIAPSKLGSVRVVSIQSHNT